MSTDNNMLNKGLVQIYTGNGKGKTTAALGLAMRASGQGLKVIIIQFMKMGQYYGEVKSIELLPNIQLESYGRKGFVYRDGVQPEDLTLAEKALSRAREAINQNGCDLLILDEINNALYYKLVTEAQVLELIADKPEQMELVLTGRNAPESIMNSAHLVTEMREIKHPYQIGIKSRKGIEF
ncbi:MAG: cob(I)yrinic acid a,c-diamide adenosyltransferase [Bacillota bacterium]|nr:cob(I)yrinic acid a,c-diamide adenosyltransferase [Bacillota bacterium]